MRPPQRMKARTTIQPLLMGLFCASCFFTAVCGLPRLAASDLAKRSLARRCCGVWAIVFGGAAVAGVWCFWWRECGESAEVASRELRGFGASFKVSGPAFVWR